MGLLTASSRASHLADLHRLICSLSCHSGNPVLVAARMRGAHAAPARTLSAGLGAPKRPPSWRRRPPH
eukprot:2658536-Pyramimonas_sp.AAC.1